MHYFTFFLLRIWYHQSEVQSLYVILTINKKCSIESSFAWCVPHITLVMTLVICSSPYDLYSYAPRPVVWTDSIAKHQLLSDNVQIDIWWTDYYFKYLSIFHPVYWKRSLTTLDISFQNDIISIPGKDWTHLWQFWRTASLWTNVVKIWMIKLYLTLHLLHSHLYC